MVKKNALAGPKNSHKAKNKMRMGNTVSGITHTKLQGSVQEK